MLARLVGQGERLVALLAQQPLPVERADRQVVLALVPHQDQRRAGPRQHEHRLLVARVEAGQPGQVREVLPVPVHHEVREPAPLHGLQGLLDPPAIFGGRRHRGPRRLAEVGPLDLISRCVLAGRMFRFIWLLGSELQLSHRATRPSPDGAVSMGEFTAAKVALLMLFTEAFLGGCVVCVG